MFPEVTEICSPHLDFDKFDESIHGVRHLAVVTTDTCQARCAHCLMKSDPKRSERLSIATFKNVLTYFETHTLLKLVAFTGGESTLLGDELLEMIAYCTELGIATRLVTNAIWATSPEDARSLLRDLRSVGLSEINFSTDDFHQVWIPLENIKTAWDATKGLGFSSVLVATCSGERSRITPEYMVDYLGGSIAIVERLKEPSDLPPRDADGTRYMVSRSPIGRLGRGARLREDLLPPYSDKIKRTVYGGCSSTFNPPTLNPDGTLGLCCGISTEYNPVLSLGLGADLISTGAYSLSKVQKIILNGIRILGPAQLLHIATGDPNIIEDRRFRSICEVCEYLTSNSEIVRSLSIQADSIAKLTATTLENANVRR